MSAEQGSVNFELNACLEKRELKHAWLSFNLIKFFCET